MDTEPLIAQITGAWQRHNAILLFLLDSIPGEGLLAVPSGSRGRDVARQFWHLQRTRKGWLHYQRTGARPELSRTAKAAPPERERLRKDLEETGEAIAEFLGRALRQEVKVRLFGRDPVRWMSYLISHESHHRGQIMLALKQNGLRIPDKVSMNGLWGKWINGK